MDSEQKSAVTRAPGDSRDNGKNGKRVFLKCIKMHIHVRMHDREGHNREKERKWNADRFSFIISTGL